MRIVGGKFKGRSLAAPAGQATRPTSDRVREAIFNILAHGIDGFAIEGARVLDLFAGTGALGLEALSRGARFCQFVDDDAEARGLIRRNADALGVIGQCKIWRRDATRLGPCAPQPPSISSSPIRPTARGSAARRWPPSSQAAGWRQARWWFWRKLRKPKSPMFPALPCSIGGSMARPRCGSTVLAKSAQTVARYPQVSAR